MKFTNLSEIINPISAKVAWEYKGTSKIEEECMSPFVKDVIPDIAKIIGYDELEFVDEECFINNDAGKFRADLVFRDPVTDDYVIVENQLGQTNHDHLGKCITYLANLKAKAFVWISESFRPEHIEAINTLNEITSEGYSFYALDLHLQKVGNDGKTYYEFVKVAGPTSVSKVSSQIRQQSSENREVSDFWEQFFTDLKKEVKKAHFNQGRTFHPITTHNKLLATFIWYKDNAIRFELSTEADDCKEKLRNIAENLNTQYGYEFIRTVGVKNKNIDKWNYAIPGEAYKKDRKALAKRCKEICININDAFEKSK